MDTQKILLGVRLNEDGKHTVRRVRDLTETDSLRLTDALDIAAQFSQNYGLYEICRANHQAIVRLNDQINEVRGLAGLGSLLCHRDEPRILEPTV